MSLRAGFALAVGAVVAGALVMRSRPAEIVSTPPAATTPAASAPAPAVSSSAPSVPPPTRFAHAKSSIEEVGRAFVAALAANDRAELEKLMPGFREYAYLMYPDFVKAGEPLIGSMGLQWAWDNLSHASHKDLNRLLDDYGGKKLVFESITTAKDQPRGPVSIFPKVVVKVKDETGQSLELRAIFAVVARDGAFKILRYRPNWD